MKIVLVSPTWTDDLGIFAGIAKKRNSQPPLGILYLAAAAEKKGHKVRVIDADVENYNTESLVDEILKGNFDIAGITATSPIFHKAASLARALKGKGFNKPILIGGEHINIFKKDAFFDCFDFAFFGDSDITFGRFLDLVTNGIKDYSAMRGFIYRDNGRVVQTEPGEQVKNLDELQFPAMHLLKHKSYVMTFVKFRKRPYLPIMATRGCPFKCVYCSEPFTNPYVRFRSPQNVADEMERWAREFGVTHFFFMDSNLTLKRDQIEGISNEILRRKLKITFEGWTRANLVDDTLLKLMRRAGLIRMSYSIESGDPEILRIIRKEVALADMVKAFEMTSRAGIEPACSVMLGLPGETRKSVERTIEFVRRIPHLLYSNFSIANPYPGTEMYKWSLSGKHGIKLLIKDFSEYTRYDNSPISVNDLGPDDLVRLQKIGLFKIHFTPKRIYAAVKMLGFFELASVLLKSITAAFLALFTGKNAKDKVSLERGA